MPTTTQPAATDRAIPGPTGGPVRGVAPAFLRDILGALHGGFRRYGDVVAYRLGPRRGPLGRDLVAAFHPDGVHQVLTGRGFDRRTTAFQVLAESLGDGLLTTDGEVWARQRRTLAPLFTPRRVAGYTDLMADEADRLLAEPAVRSAGVVDLHLLMQRYALRVVGRALFGADVDDVVAALHRLVPQASHVVRLRTLQVLRLPLRVPTPRNRRLVGIQAEGRALVDRILDRRRTRPGPRDGDDLLSRLSAATDPQTGRPLSEQEVRDQALTFLLAGHETTAGALTFTLQLLGRHPAVQADVASGPADLARAAVQEGMRLYPPVYLTERRAATDVAVGGYLVPHGSTVLASPWVTHRHPAVWPDPLRFDPGRFVGRQERPRYAYFPFGGGPRSCIGEQFALLEASVLLRTLLSRYRVVTPDDDPIGVAPLTTLRPPGPVPARLLPRRLSRPPAPAAGTP